MEKLGFYGHICPHSLYGLNDTWSEFKKQTKYNFIIWLNSWDKSITESRFVSFELLLEWINQGKIVNDGRRI